MTITPYILIHILNPSTLKQVIVEKTKQQELILEDGTKVTLDAGSHFKYPEKISVNKREVYLEGEGYFEVAPNPDKPFIIHANDALIKVLGTKFNVRAWRENKRVIVAVAEGKVSLKPEIQTHDNANVIIAQDQISILEENKNPSTPQYVDINQHLSWQKKEMYFKSVALCEVLDQLERWYDLIFHLTDTEFASQRVTLFIENKPVEEILEVIALVNNFKYEQNGKEIIFSSNE
jgi:ferric-dicitrate binding protein FerR (iron transport regulator)